MNGVVPRQGAWDIRDAAFNEARDIKKWVILNNNARIDERRLNDFAHFICKEGKSRGMNIAPPEKILQIRNQQDLSQKLQLCKSNEIQVIRLPDPCFRIILYGINYVFSLLSWSCPGDPLKNIPSSKLMLKYTMAL